jgi:hypothetical protein
MALTPADEDILTLSTKNDKGWRKNKKVYMYRYGAWVSRVL